MEIIYLRFILILLLLGTVLTFGIYLVFIKFTGLKLIYYFPKFEKNKLDIIFSILSGCSAFFINWLIMKKFSFLIRIIHPIASVLILYILIYLTLKYLFIKKPLSNYEKKQICGILTIVIFLELLIAVKYLSIYFNTSSSIMVALVFFTPVSIFLIVMILYEAYKKS